jgi:hypothetical protein
MDKKKAQIKATKKMIFDKLEAALSEVKSAKEDEGFAKLLKKASKMLAKYLSKEETAELPKNMPQEGVQDQVNRHFKPVSKAEAKNNPIKVIEAKNPVKPKKNQKDDKVPATSPLNGKAKPAKAGTVKKSLPVKTALKTK